MCSISGVIIATDDLEKQTKIASKLRELVIRAEQRGRDSYGIAFLGQDYVNMDLKALGKPSDSLVPFKWPGQAVIAINNNRAEPTTEYVAKKEMDDVQPFTDGTVVVSHNGTIANDKELESGYNLCRPTKIDTAILPPLLTKEWNGFDDSGLRSILTNVITGSYALAIWHKDNPKTLWLATNYKPLCLLHDFELNCIFFTSLESSFEQDDVLDSKTKQWVVPPYTLVKITVCDSCFNITQLSLWRDVDDYEKQKALVVCSGGLDSTTCAKWAQVQGYDVTLLHFLYHCRAEDREREAVKAVARQLNCPLVEIPVDFFRDVIGHSRLTNTKDAGDLVKDRDGEASAELAWEWVPARNLIFLSIAAGYAEAHEIGYIILGGNLEESGAYPDNELIFQQRFSELLPYSLDLQHHVRLLWPVANLMKHEIVKMALDIKAPIRLAWSCYEGTGHHCGRCGPCMMRRTGFKMAGTRDMIEYDWLPEGFFDGCAEPPNLDE